MNQPLTCIDPSAISAGDLMVYVDGLAPASVTAHVHACAACTLEVERLRSLQAALRVTLDRRNCPEPDLLGQLAANLLTGGMKLVVARHVQQCPACAQELIRYSQPLLPAAAMDFVGRGVDAIRRVTAALRWTPTPPLAAVRGAALQQSFYHSHSLDLLVGYAHTTADVGRIAGAILLRRTSAASPAPAMPMAQILLAQGDTPVAETEADALGHFVIEAVAPGAYELLVHWQDELVYVADLAAAPGEY